MKINESNKPEVIMVSPGRNVMGGISTVVNSYYVLGLDKKTDLKFISSMEDESKVKKLIVALFAYVRFCLCVKKYDIVHIHMAAQASFTRKALFVKKAFKAGKKIIIHQHSADFDEYYFNQSDEAQREKIKKTFSYADKVIVLSDEWAKFFGENVCDKNKIETLYNGVILPDYEKQDYDDKNVLFLGRLGERKGTYDLLKAVPKVLEKVPDAKFYLGGDGDVEQCKAIAEKQEFAESVEFLGWVRDKEKDQYLKKCSTFILPSYHEGMPMSVLEAMSYGLATVSTNAGGIPQIINNSEDGIRIQAGDTEAIAETLIKLLTDTEMKFRLGQAGRKRIEACFNAERNIDKLIDIYKRLEE